MLHLRALALLISLPCQSCAHLECKPTIRSTLNVRNIVEEIHEGRGSNLGSILDSSSKKWFGLNPGIKCSFVEFLGGK